MALVSIKELFGTPWGVVEHRRQEIERGPYGAFDKIYAEELGKKFYTIDQASGFVGVGRSAARKWLDKCKARFIDEGGGQSLYA